MACWRMQQGTEASRWHVMTREQQLAVRRFLSHDKDLIIILNVLRIYLERWGRERLREREKEFPPTGLFSGCWVRLNLGAENSVQFPTQCE